MHLATRMLRSSGASELQTGATARSIRDAEADGIRTVGLSYLPTYCDHVACGKVVGDAVPRVHRPRAATVVVDAGNGFCHPAFEAADDPLVDAARTCGVGVLAIEHSYSAGVLGWFVERLARQRAGRADVRQLLVAHGACRWERARSSVPTPLRGPHLDREVCRWSPICRRRPSRGSR